MIKSIPLAAIAAILMSHAASAAISATATTDLNMRSGPGPQYGVVNVIAANQPVIITGCIDGSRWCMVNAGAFQGWAYSDYLATNLNGVPIVLGDQTVALGVPVIPFDATFAATSGVVTEPAIAPVPGVVAGAAVGAAVAGPVGAVVGGAIGASTAPTVVATALPPPAEVNTYIVSRPVPSAFVAGSVVVGETLPPSVTLMPVPAYSYQYAYVNGLPVLVEPSTRQVVYIAGG